MSNLLSKLNPQQAEAVRYIDGPLLVIVAGGASGKTMTGYPELEPDITAANAKYINCPVVTDGNLVTVRGWPDNGPWMREFVKLVKQQKNV